MLNLFLINSYQTYIVARLVIDKDNTPRDKNIFIFLRGVKPLNPSSYIPYDWRSLVVENNMPEFPTYLKFYKGMTLKRDLLHQIRSLTNCSKFKLHTFQTISRIVQLIRSMPECEKTAVLEEGISDRPRSIDELSDLYRYDIKRGQKLLNFLNYGTSIKNNGFVNKELQFYCLFDEAFPGAKNLTNLFDIDKIINIVKPKTDVKPNSVFFIHTWFHEPTSLQLFELYAALVFQMCRNYSGRKIYHRFHPAQREISKDLVREKFKSNNMEFLELPNSEPIEGYLFSDTPLTFIGSRSSVLCYAKRLGKEVDAALG